MAGSMRPGVASRRAVLVLCVARFVGLAIVMGALFGERRQDCEDTAFAVTAVVQPSLWALRPSGAWVHRGTGIRSGDGFHGCQGAARACLMRPVPLHARRRAHAPRGTTVGAAAAAAVAPAVVGEARGAGVWPALYAWVNNTGMDTSDIAIEVAPVDLAPGELGLIAKSDLEPGDILAWAPTSILLNKAKAVDLWGDIMEDVPDRTAILLLLIYERCIRGEASQWSTYWRALPSFAGDVSGPSFLWEEEEWEWLLGSDCYPASIQMHNAVIDMYNDLQPLFEQRPLDFPPEAFSIQNFFWASGCIASRAYGDDAEGSRLAIAPLVDFLNHKAGALQLTRFSNGIVAYAHRHYQQGEQVFVSYGAKNNAQLLSQYGFVDEYNQDEAIFLRMGEHLDLREPHLQAKRALLAELLDDGRDPDAAILRLARRPREWEATLLPAMRILALSAGDALPATARDMAPTQSPALEAAALELLASAIDRRDAEYPGTLEDNRRELGKGGLSERASLGLKLRISEREVLVLSKQHCLEQATFARQGADE